MRGKRSKDLKAFCLSRQTMNRTIQAVYSDGQIRPLEPLELAEGTSLTIVVDVSAGGQEEKSTERRADPLAMIGDIADDLGPPDLAANLDHYLYGTAKRQ